MADPWQIPERAVQGRMAGRSARGRAAGPGPDSKRSSGCCAKTVSAKPWGQGYAALVRAILRIVKKRRRVQPGRSGGGYPT
jgi:hypothetical protein